MLRVCNELKRVICFKTDNKNEIKLSLNLKNLKYKLIMTEFSRIFAMPNSKTFSIKPIRQIIEKYIETLPEESVIIDPFSKDSDYASLSNDLDPDTQADFHLHAIEFLDLMIEEYGENVADMVLLDPPYSPRQISECYKGIGRKVTSTDTQNARLYKECKDRLKKLLAPGGIAITFGWNSGGFGKKRKFQMLEILMVYHGAAHNDTIVTVERKL